MAELFERITAQTYSGTYSNSIEAKLTEAQSIRGAVAVLELPNSKKLLSPSGNDTFFLVSLFKTLTDGWLLSRNALIEHYFQYGTLLPPITAAKSGMFVTHLVNKYRKHLPDVGYDLRTITDQEGDRERIYYGLGRRLELSEEEAGALASSMQRRIELLPQYGWKGVFDLQPALDFLSIRLQDRMDAHPLGRSVSELAIEAHKKLNRILLDPEAQEIIHTHDPRTQQVLGFILTKLQSRELNIDQIVASLTGKIETRGEQSAIGSAFSSASEINSVRKVIVGAREIPTLPAAPEEV